MSHLSPLMREALTEALHDGDDALNTWHLPTLNALRRRQLIKKAYGDWRLTYKGRLVAQELT